MNNGMPLVQLSEKEILDLYLKGIEFKKIKSSICDLFKVKTKNH